MIAKRVGLVVGPLGFLLLVLLAEPLYPGGSAPLPGAIKVGAVAFLMAAWWVTEAIPIPATSLLPLVLFPILGVSTPAGAAKEFANPFIFLLMGGFFVALALEKWNLHRRIALSVVLRVGTRPDRLVLGFMIAGAVLSMWISNTATTLMMMPIALAVLQRTEESGQDPALVKPLGVALMLGIAYACNVGGLGTQIGTPPNLIFMGQYTKIFGQTAPTISFLDWMIMALPIVVVMVIAIWLILTRIVNRIDPSVEVGEVDALRSELTAMGSLTRPERRVLGIFVACALLWVFRKPIAIGDLSVGGWAGWLGIGGRVDDGTVAIGAAILMFLMSSGEESDDPARRRLLDWETAVKIPWGLLLLFGGGLALAHGFKITGLSGWVGHRLGGLAGLPTWMMIGLVCLSVTFLTEITSNTATTTILMPVLGAVCVEQGIDPMHLMLPAALSASCAFMLPVATAPNAIVFGTGRVSMGDMVRCGVAINLIGVVVITAVLLI